MEQIGEIYKLQVNLLTKMLHVTLHVNNKCAQTIGMMLLFIIISHVLKIGNFVFTDVQQRKNITIYLKVYALFI